MDVTTNIQINLFNIRGQKAIPAIQEKVKQGQNTFTVDLAASDISPGIYFIVLKSATGKLWRRKIMLM
jgi:hypothetical protein